MSSPLRTDLQTYFFTISFIFCITFSSSFSISCLRQFNSIQNNYKLIFFAFGTVKTVIEEFSQYNENH